MLKTSANTVNNRLPHLDLLRLLAIFLVIFNHTGEYGYMLFSADINAPVSLLYMMISIFCKIAVPLFFMITGALLLPKEETLQQLLSKRVLRILIILVFISVPYYIWLHSANGISIASFFTFIYSDSASTALWYLYSYLALLLLLPFLRSMVKNLQQKDYRYLLLGYLVFVGFLPCIEYLLWGGNHTLHESLTPVLFVTQNVFFALIGYYLEHIKKTETKHKIKLFWSILLSMLSILLTCFMTFYIARSEENYTPHQLEQFFNCFICIPAISIYTMAKQLSNRIKSARICKWISLLGSAVFGVYLIEKILRSVTSSVLVFLLPYVGSLVASLVWCVATLCLGLIIIVTLKHIPVINKVVNMFI